MTEQDEPSPGASLDLQVEGAALLPAEALVRKTKTRRAQTISERRITKRELRADALLYEPELEELDAIRPRVRADCEDGERPCPFVGCKHHLYLDVNVDSGSITFNYPSRDPDEIPETCSLDVADRGGVTLADVGETMQLSRERIRQLEEKMFSKLKRKHPELAEIIAQGGFEHGGEHVADYYGEGEGGASFGEPDPNPDELFAEKVFRVYERTSRERSMNMRIETSPPEEQEVSREFHAPLHYEGNIQSSPGAIMKKNTEYELTDKQKAILTAYTKLAKKYGHKPSPLEVAQLAGMKGERGAISASVCTALKRLHEVGVDVPFYDQKAPRFGKAPAEGTPKRRSGGRKKRTPVEEIVDRDPKPGNVISTSTAMIPVTSSEHFKTVLQMKREALQKQVDAIDVLLNT